MTERRVMRALLLSRHEFLLQNELASSYPWADRFVMGLPVAPWQRELKWSQAQCVRFIQSAWQGIPLGTYTLVEEVFAPSQAGDASGIVQDYLSNAVIDGQQRLHAIELYVSDQLAVDDINGVPRLWSEIDPIDRAFFAQVPFPRTTVTSQDEAELRRYYDLMNFGGVAHTESERAANRAPRSHQ